MDQLDQRIISFVQGDLPLVGHPFAELARELGVDEAVVVERLRAMAASGRMRRFGATLRHQKSGFAANVMVAWRVPEDQCDEVGEKLAAFRRVSHCYHRAPCPDFPYNIYTMVHGTSDEDCRRIVAEMVQAAGGAEYDLLFSRQELKKTSMRYY